MARTGFCGILSLFLASFTQAEDINAKIAKFRKVPAQAKALLDKATKVELYSLDPTFRRQKKGNLFHNYKVLGKTELKPIVQKDVIQALYRGVKENLGVVAGCFKPRHGIRAHLKDKKVDIVVCFECLSMTVYYPGGAQGVWTSRSPAKLFNTILKKAKVPLPPQPKN